MSTTKTPSNRTRRSKFGAYSLVLIIAATISAGLAGAIADRFNAQYDVTATREHSLAARTQGLLDQLDQDVEIIVVADQRQVDARVRNRMRDVLAALDRASPRITITRIDPVTDVGRAEFERVSERVRGLYEEDIERRRDTVEEAVAAAEAMAAELDALSTALLDMEPALRSVSDPRAAEVENVAAVARLQAQSLRQTAAQSQSAIDGDLSAIESARAALAAAFASQRDQLQQFVLEIENAARDAEGHEAVRAQWLAARAIAARARDEAALQADALLRLGPSEANAVMRILASADAVIVMADGRSTAIPFTTLFPTTERIDEAGGVVTDLRFIGEELLTTAIASLTRSTTPIVAIVHNLPGRLVTETGEPSSPQAAQAIGAMLDRFQLRGMGVREWPIVLDATRPTRITLDPSGERPIVWVAFGTEGTSADASQRFDAYARAVEGLIEDGESVLVSVAPSTRPASGGEDPLSTALQPLGVNPQSGFPLVRSVRTATGRAFDLSFVIRQSESDHIIANAIDGLPLTLTWVTPFEIDDDATATAIIAIEDSPDVWAEAEWRAHANAPDDRPWGSPAPPEPNDIFDIVDGPWPIAVAIEHRASPSSRQQRVIAVGSPGWFFDRLANRTATAEGRTITLSPGNHELLEASIYWLAGQNDMIAPSARTADIPRIGPMSDAQLALIRYSLILGLPLLVLAIGAGLRMTLLR